MLFKVGDKVIRPAGSGESLFFEPGEARGEVVRVTSRKWDGVPLITIKWDRSRLSTPAHNNCVTLTQEGWNNYGIILDEGLSIDDAIACFHLLKLLTENAVVVKPRPLHEQEFTAEDLERLVIAYDRWIRYCVTRAPSVEFANTAAKLRAHALEAQKNSVIDDDKPVPLSCSLNDIFVALRGREPDKDWIQQRQDWLEGMRLLNERRRKPRTPAY